MRAAGPRSWGASSANGLAAGQLRRLDQDFLGGRSSQRRRAVAQARDGGWTPRSNGSSSTTSISTSATGPIPRRPSRRRCGPWTRSSGRARSSTGGRQEWTSEDIIVQASREAGERPHAPRHGAAAIQHARPRPRREGVPAALRGARLGTTTGQPWHPACSPASTTTACLAERA